MTSVAAPILGRSNEVIAALSVVTPSADVDPVALTPAVTAVCRSISAPCGSTRAEDRCANHWHHRRAVPGGRRRWSGER